MNNVAIACQGGGSHTAFTAGALTEMFANWDEDDRLVGISGTSGGALNAVVAWSGYVTEGPEAAIDRLDALWTDIAVDGPVERTANLGAVWYRSIVESGLPLPRMSPYHVPLTSMAQSELKRLIERHVDFDRVRQLCRDPDRPRLVVGTVNVNAGEFETFEDGDVTAEAVLASAAVPDLFRAVEINGHYHWDGLFSQNPPVHELMDLPDGRKPDELWVIQINPQDREGEPRSLHAITDRRNELAGNISLNQELAFIERVNEWIETGYLQEGPFTRTAIHRIEMDRQLHYSSKADRSREFIDELRALGSRRAEEFLANRRD
ncbi:MAG: patatin-like phospholipase family protein [Halobacteriota archaeon]